MTADAGADWFTVTTQQVEADGQGRHSRSPMETVLRTHDPDEAIARWQILVHEADEHVEIRLTARPIPRTEGEPG